MAEAIAIVLELGPDYGAVLFATLSIALVVGTLAFVIVRAIRPRQGSPLPAR